MLSIKISLLSLLQAIPCEGVEHTVHNFTAEQPIKGNFPPNEVLPSESDYFRAPELYYLRNVMHDYPDYKCAIILRQIMDVMDKDSVILIDEMVLPNKGAHWHQT